NAFAPPVSGRPPTGPGAGRGVALPGARSTGSAHAGACSWPRSKPCGPQAAGANSCAVAGSLFPYGHPGVRARGVNHQVERVLLPACRSVEHG
ncbi:hypothetical protein, partial [Streptomyces sp. NPDC127574]|uniref:hypothetical protein n=1 Tax=Streptomyces sp. NPDC127574 TaxID=3345401 RepID=UPI00362EBA55